MKASDVVAQLQAVLPLQTDKFTDNLSVASITRTSGFLTVVTDEEHSLIKGAAVVLTGCVEVISTTPTRSGTTGTVVTATDHDLTLKTTLDITLSGADDAAFNGTFAVIDIPNRRSVRFTMADSGVTATSGPSVIEGAESPFRRYNGLYAVESTPSKRSFTVLHPALTLLDPQGTITARASSRISAGVDPDKVVRSYTEQKIDDYWAFVVLGDVDASKDRDIRSDAISNATRGNYYRQQIIQPFSIYVFIPASEEVAGRAARDQAEDLFHPICRSVLWVKFDSGLASGPQNTVQFSSHSSFRYNDAVYVHEFAFAQVADLTESDCVDPDFNVAMRDIVLRMIPDLGTRVNFMTADIDLDETPL